jgi:hypothetical protein
VQLHRASLASAVAGNNGGQLVIVDLDEFRQIFGSRAIFGSRT